MKARHEKCATNDISRKTNEIVNTVDYVLTYMLKNVSPEDAKPIYTDLVALKNDLTSVGISLNGIKSAIQTFITKRGITFDISKYTNTNLTALNSKLAETETFLATMKADIDKSPKLDQVATKADSYHNPMVNISPVNYDTDTWYTNIVNDLLDAASYTLKGINPDNGTTLGMTDAQKKDRVRGYLNQIPNFNRPSFIPELKADYDAMNVVADYVITNLNSVPLGTLGTYIDTNVEKLPIIRRNWA